MGNPAPHMRTKTAKPSHRHSGSVSSISVASEDFTSPNRDVNSSASSVSSASLKEKRLKRRTRSSLGGTEDFIKELDFLTPSSNKKAPEATSKSVGKSQIHPGGQSSSGLEASSSAPKSVAAVPAVPAVPAAEAVGTERQSVVLDKIGVSATNGTSSDVKKLNDVAEKSPQSEDAVAKYADGTHEVDAVSHDSNPSDVVNPGPCENQNGIHLTMENGGERSVNIATADSLPDVTNVESGHTEEAGAPPAGDSSYHTGEETKSAELSTSATRGSQIINEQRATEPGSNEVLPGATPTVANGDTHSISKKQKLPKASQGVKERQLEEKVSVQKRIEQLERIAGGRPVHFRSQSLSLPRPFEISHARHHEAEGGKGSRMPLYQAPLDARRVTSEQGIAGSVTRDKERPQGHGPSGKQVRALEEVTAPVDAAVTDGAQVISGTEQLQDDQRQTSKGHAGSLEGGESLQCGMGMPGEIKAQAAAAEKTGVDIGKEDTTTTKLDGAQRIQEGKASAGTIPENENMANKDLPTGTAKIEDSTWETAEYPTSVEGAGKRSSRVAPVGGTSDDVVESSPTGGVFETPKSGLSDSASDEAAHAAEPACQDDETSVLLTRQPAVDPLFVDSQQDRLWEMHSQELALGDGESGPEVRESSAHDDDASQYANGTPSHAEASVSGGLANGNSQASIDKSGKIDRPRTPLRSLLAEEEAAEKGPGSDSGQRSSTPQNQILSPRGNLFKRIVSGGRNSPTKPTPSSQFGSKTQPAAKPFLSSCICCSVK